MGFDDKAAFLVGAYQTLRATLIFRRCNSGRVSLCVMHVLFSSFTKFKGKTDCLFETHKLIQFYLEHNANSLFKKPFDIISKSTVLLYNM